MAHIFFKLLLAVSIFLFCLAAFIGLTFKGSPSGLVSFLFAASGVSFIGSITTWIASLIGWVFRP